MLIGGMLWCNIRSESYVRSTDRSNTFALRDLIK